LNGTIVVSIAAPISIRSMTPSWLASAPAIVNRASPEAPVTLRFSGRNCVTNTAAALSEASAAFPATGVARETRQGQDDETNISFS
jgi:hypothetical protein